MPELVISDGLKLGIRNFDENGRNSERLVSLCNAKPTPRGIVSHEPVTFPSALQSAISGESITVSHPFPQLFRGANYTLLFSETKVYTVNESTWALTELSLKDLAGSPATIASGGGAWQFADFGESWWAFNGVTTVVRCNKGGTFNVYVDTATPTQTGCNYAGRSVFGGFDPANYWNGDWDTLHAYLTSQHISSPGGLTANGLGSNFIAWSSIGGGDSLGILFEGLIEEGPELYSTGGHDVDRSIYMDFLERNECGFMPMDWQGTVWCIKRLGENAIVYGDNGISVITQISDPFPTFGQQTLRRFGIAGRTAVGGDERAHLLIDASGRMWRLTPDLAFEELNYDEALSGLVTDHISIVHNPQRDEFHITGTHPTDGVVTFTLTESGLYRHKHAPTSAEFIGTALIGVYQTLSGLDYLDVQTDTIDFGNRDIKTIHSIALGVTATTPLHCRVYYRSNSSNAWSATPLVPFSEKGIADVVASGVEFQIQIYTEDYTVLERMDYIRLIWRELGVRNFRGYRS